MNIRKAERKQAKIRLALQGPSGSGKTYSSLLIARGLVDDWPKVVIIDTENFSADLYAHLGSFNVLSTTPPYSPEKYIEAITACIEAGMEVIIIDSISHEWDGQGGWNTLIGYIQLQLNKNVTVAFCRGLTMFFSLWLWGIY